MFLNCDVIVTKLSLFPLTKYAFILKCEFIIYHTAGGMMINEFCERDANLVQTGKASER